jgi:hypothetical protein
MKEGTFTQTVIEALKRVNTEVLVLVMSRGTTSGWPDRYISHTKWRGWLEFKTRKGGLRQDQIRVMNSLNDKHPGSAYVIREPDVIELVDGTRIDVFTSALGLLQILREDTDDWMKGKLRS